MTLAEGRRDAETRAAFGRMARIEAAISGARPGRVPGRV
jgi:hypothetical protein